MLFHQRPSRLWAPSRSCGPCGPRVTSLCDGNDPSLLPRDQVQACYFERLVTYNSRISLITDLKRITRTSRDGYRWLDIHASKRFIIEQQASMNLSPDVRVKACSTTEHRIEMNPALPSYCNTLPVIHSYSSWDEILNFWSEHVSLWG